MAHHGLFAMIVERNRKVVISERLPMSPPTLAPAPFQDYKSLGPILTKFHRFCLIAIAKLNKCETMRSSFTLSSCGRVANKCETMRTSFTLSSFGRVDNILLPCIRKRKLTCPTDEAGVSVIAVKSTQPNADKLFLLFLCMRSIVGVAINW